jgi:hypothetical protein
MSKQAIVYAIEVNHPLRGWVRMQQRYREKATAKSWLRFVKKAWHGLPVRITEEVTK